jgi:hypothetical protein
MLSRSTASALLVALSVILVAPTVWAQDRPPVVSDTFKKALLDPTTYAPAAIVFDATMRDWNSSQPFFRRGYLERNERYTISGRPNDAPLGYSAGQRQILWDAFLNAQVSFANNVAARAFERKLKDRFPNHRKLITALSWAERIGFASWMSYRLSEAHYRQAAENRNRAARLGFR